MRLGAVCLLLLPYGSRGEADASVSTGRVGGPARFVACIALMLAVVGLVHGEDGLVLESLGGLAATLLVLRSSLRRASSDELPRAALHSLMMLVLGSLALLVYAPNLGLQQGRLRGLMSNPNLLGFYAFLGLALGLFGRLSLAMRVVAVGACLGTIWLTDSRTSFIAAAVLVILRAASRSGLYWRIVGVIGLGLGSVAAFEALAGNRALSTRDMSLYEAGRALAENLWLGVGEGGIRYEVASGPLRAAAMGGIAGICLFILAWALLFAYAVRAGAPVRALVLAAFVHNLSEGWAVSTFGAMLQVFLVCVISLSAPARTHEERRRAEVELDCQEPSAATLRP